MFINEKVNFVECEDDVGKEDGIIRYVRASQIKEPGDFIQIRDNQKLAALFLHLRTYSVNLLLPRLASILKWQGKDWIGGWTGSIGAPRNINQIPRSGYERVTRGFQL